MKTGKCGLCGKSRVIKRSHLLPKSAYKQVRDHPSDGGGSPMRIDILGGRFGRTDKQIVADFLCGSCEGAFSRFGEASVSKAWGTHFGFPMLKFSNGLVPVSFSARRKIYASAQLSESLVDALYYFAVSVVWRAVMWPQDNVGVSSCRGAISDRQMHEVVDFLLSGNGRLSDFFVVVDVNTCVEMNGILSLPALISNSDVKTIGFDVLGLRFKVFVGPAFPVELEKLREDVDKYILIVSSDHSQSESAKQVALFFHENNIS
ncbi:MULTISPECIES: hypothetical protein [unclassified Pseudomonas]|uniref:hypothetical protein n=1 Tax=unclassified Pseudomonas TaxID=196821 RepID=UPI001A9EA7D6|nr:MULTISPECIES: hypothetical protein [unclassified Pseudomonas]